MGFGNEKYSDFSFNKSFARNETVWALFVSFYINFDKSLNFRLSPMKRGLIRTEGCTLKTEKSIGINRIIENFDFFLVFG